MSSSNLPVRSDFSKMPRTGGHVPTVTVAPDSASALQIAQPYPVESATPATKATFSCKVKTQSTWMPICTLSCGAAVLCESRQEKTQCLRL